MPICLVFFLLLASACVLIAWLPSRTQRPLSLSRLRWPRLQFSLRALLLPTVVFCAALATTRGVFATGLFEGLIATAVCLIVYGVAAAFLAYFVREIWLVSRFGRRSSLAKQVRGREKVVLPKADQPASDGESCDDSGSRRPNATPWWARQGANRYRPYGQGRDYQLPSEFHKKVRDARGRRHRAE